MIIKRILPLSMKKKIYPFYVNMMYAYYMMDAKIHPSAYKYHCSCCGVKLKSFIDGKFRNKSNVFNPERYMNTLQEVKCPICGTIPRHRILACWLEEHINEFNGDILYFACEQGMKRWMKRHGIRITTADLLKPADLKLDLEKIDQPDSSWDWIVCNHVLEHVNDYKSALHELYRILKPGGRLIISFPILESLPTLIEEKEHTDDNKKKRLELYGQTDHLRVFGTDSGEILQQAGFEVSRIDGNKMPEEILPVVGPADYDVNYLFVCKKPE